MFKLELSPFDKWCLSFVIFNFRVKQTL